MNKTIIIILAIILAVAAIVVGIIYGTRPSKPPVDTSTAESEDTSGDETSPAECVHEYEDTVVDATCLEAGYTEHRCSKCNDSYRDTEVEALGHDFVKGATIAPTYETEGYTEYKCSRCDVVEKRDTVPAVKKPDDTCEHDYADTLHLPTCVDKGYTEHVCKKCGGVIIDTEVDAVGHLYIDTVKEATCAAAGYTEHVCSRCGNTYRDAEVPATGHSFVAGKIVAPTYEADGYTEYVCSKCGVTEKRDIVAKLVKPVDDTYTDTVIAPTCTEKGYTLRKYNEDGREEHINETAALGHSYIDTVLKPTCTNDGYVEHKCTRCGDSSKDITSKLSHDYSATVIAPTCVDKGYTVHRCAKCGDSYRDSETAALGHTYATVVTAPTCARKGFTTHTCGVCGKVYTDNTVPALGHSFIADYVVAPTVTAKGYTVYKCAVCGETENRDYVDKLPDPDEEQYTDTIIAPTCTEKGYTKRVYEGGRVEYLNYVDELGHIYGVTKTVAPTCTQEGYIVNTCSECGSHYNTPTGAAHGHNFVGAWVVETPATATTYGSEYQVCSLCGEKRYRLIPNIGGDGTARTDVYEEAHYEAGRTEGERNYYSAADYTNPICMITIVDYTLNATVTHIGYLEFRVKFVDNTGNTQEFDIRYEYDDEFIYESFADRSLIINADGSYTIDYCERLS